MRKTLSSEYKIDVTCNNDINYKQNENINRENRNDRNEMTDESLNTRTITIIRCIYFFNKYAMT